MSGGHEQKLAGGNSEDPVHRVRAMNFNTPRPEKCEVADNARLMNPTVSSNKASGSLVDAVICGTSGTEKIAGACAGVRAHPKRLPA